MTNSAENMTKTLYYKKRKPSADARFAGAFANQTRHRTDGFFLYTTLLIQLTQLLQEPQSLQPVRLQVLRSCSEYLRY